MVSPLCRKCWRWLERSHCVGGLIDIKEEFIAENNFSFVSYSVAPDMSMTLANDGVSWKRTFKDFIVRLWTHDEGINYAWPISCLSFIFSYFLINSGCVPILCVPILCVLILCLTILRVPILCVLILCVLILCVLILCVPILCVPILCVPIFMPMGYTFFQIKKECCVVKYTVHFSRNVFGLHNWFRLSFNTRDDDRGNIQILSKTWVSITAWRSFLRI
jgi:hypothetical protein